MGLFYGIKENLFKELNGVFEKFFFLACIISPFNISMFFKYLLEYSRINFK